MNNPEEKKPDTKKHIHLPEILKIDFDKPVPFRQQFAIMCTVLLISCILFSIVYLQQLLSGNIATAQETTTEPSEQSESDTSTQPEPSETQTSQPEPSKNEESSAIAVQKADTKLLGEMTTVTLLNEELHKGNLILVNKDYSCRYDGENVESIMEEKSNTYVVTDSTVSLDLSIVDDLNDMLDDFAAIYGDTDIMIACGYRSYDTQVSLFNEEIDSVGSGEAEQWVAPPGYSEHQTGLVFDFDLNIQGGDGIDYNGDGIYSWINENCEDYGFIVRYISGKEEITGYSEEPWHFRYVGIPHSQYIADNGITLEEYLDIIHMHKSDDPALIEDHDGTRWCIYYVEAGDYDETNIPVPENYEYEISGDNYSGFIVTVKLD